MDFSNDAWIKFQDDVNAGRIGARDAVEYVLARDSGVHGGQLAALLSFIREQETKEAARDKNQAIIIAFLERQEAAAVELRQMFQVFDARITAVEVSLKARDERSNRVQARVNENSERIEAIDNFIKVQVAQIQSDIQGLRQAFDEDRVERKTFQDESLADRREMRQRIERIEADVKRLVGDGR